MDFKSEATIAAEFMKFIELDNLSGFKTYVVTS